MNTIWCVLPSWCVLCTVCLIMSVSFVQEWQKQCYQAHYSWCHSSLPPPIVLYTSSFLEHWSQHCILCNDHHMLTNWHYQYYSNSRCSTYILLSRDSYIAIIRALKDISGLSWTTEWAPAILWISCSTFSVRTLTIIMHIMPGYRVISLAWCGSGVYCQLAA